MPDYRLYLLEGNLILGPPVIIACASDQEAIETAQKRLGARDVEVWKGARCVTRLKAPDAKS